MVKVKCKYANRKPYATFYFVFKCNVCTIAISDIFIYFIYFAHNVTILKGKKSDKTKIIEQSLMAWQHKDVGITPTNANSL